jgi:tetratricopeptide (TPR) repeat protein
LSNALKLYHAPLTGSPEAPNSDVSFPSENQKYEKALLEFQTVASSYASHTAGKIAKYYAGLCLRDLNRTDEAIKELEPLSKEKSDYGALALEVLGTIYENMGNTTKAIEVYQKLVADDAPAAPNRLDLLHLAKLYEQQNNSAEAVKVYQRVIKEFPGSSYASDAEQRLKQLFSIAPHQGSARCPYTTCVGGNVGLRFTTPVQLLKSRTGRPLLIALMSNSDPTID